MVLLYQCQGARQLDSLVNPVAGLETINQEQMSPNTATATVQAPVGEDLPHTTIYAP